MKKRLPLGLVVEGSSTNSALLRLPTLSEELGPVKSATVRVARRLSNFLKAGYAVAQYEDLQAARLILLRVPDSAVVRVVGEICRSELLFKNLSFLLCASWLPSDVLQPLADRGATVATAVSVPSSREKWFVVEGQLPAVRQVRRFIERSEGRAFEIRPGTKQLYFAAQLLTTALPVPFFLDAQQALRASGITGNHLYALLDELAREMFRSFVSGSRMNWGGPLTECSEETVTSYLSALRMNHPHIAQTVEEQLSWARRKMPVQRHLSGRPVL
jgi:predicted short-subunit dehydrogenase-like oxidoreductase (DUF2520 family)